MAMLGWTMMGLAIWHFTIFLPDRFWGGIVGAFLGALFGAIIFGFIVNGFAIPGEADTLLVAFRQLAAVPVRHVVHARLLHHVVDAHPPIRGG